MPKPFAHIALSMAGPPGVADPLPYITAALAVIPFLQALTWEEWALLRDSPRCEQCGHLLVLRKWPEYVPCCAIPDCSCEVHTIVEPEWPDHRLAQE